MLPWIQFFLMFVCLFTFWPMKSAELTFSSPGLQSNHGQIDNYQRITLTLKKTQKSDDSQGNSAAVFLNLISNHVCGYLFTVDCDDNVVLGKV